MTYAHEFRNKCTTMSLKLTNDQCYLSFYMMLTFINFAKKKKKKPV